MIEDNPVRKKGNKKAPRYGTANINMSIQRKSKHSLEKHEPQKQLLLQDHNSETRADESRGLIEMRASSVNQEQEVKPMRFFNHSLVTSDP